MTRIHIWGAAGYAAAEALRYIHDHPQLCAGVLESRSHAGQLLSEHFPALRSTPYRFDAPGMLLDQLQAGDLVITAGSHGQAVTIVPELLARGARVVDLSADYRFDDDATYGLTEYHRAEIAGAALVANPGCYPTATLLATLPLRAVGTIAHVIADAKSGITGAGRNPSVGALFAEVNDDIRAYGLLGHRHQPEIERLFNAHGISAKLTFTPHVVPLVRGMLVDAYAIFAHDVDKDAIAAAYARAYADSTFVRVLSGESAPSVAAVARTNGAEIRVDVSGNVVRVICAIDNLGKGAAGQAIQNINTMLGIPEETGLVHHCAAA